MPVRTEEGSQSKFSGYCLLQRYWTWRYDPELDIREGLGRAYIYTTTFIWNTHRLRQDGSDYVMDETASSPVTLLPEYR